MSGEQKCWVMTLAAVISIVCNGSMHTSPIPNKLQGTIEASNSSEEFINATSDLQLHRLRK